MTQEKEKGYRLNKVIKELNIGSSTVVGYLGSRGFKVEDNLNTKLTQEMYDLLMKEFASEKKLKEKAEQIKQHSGTDTKTSNEEQEPTTPALSAQALKVEMQEPKVVAEKPAEKPDEKPIEKVVEPVVAEVVVQPEVVVEAPVVEEKMGLKVVGKVDLDAYNNKGKGKGKTKAAEKPAEGPSLFDTPAVVVEAETKPKKKTIKTEEAVPVVAEQPVVVEVAPVVEPVVVTEEPEIEIAAIRPEDELIRAKDSTPKLTGLKVMGKIELPSKNDQKAKDLAAKEAEIKRKRKRTTPTPLNSGGESLYGEHSGSASTKKPGVNTGPPAPNTGAPTTSGGTGRPGDKKKGGKTEPNQKEVQSNVRNTLQGLNKNTGRKGQRMRRDKRDVRAAQRDQVEQERIAASTILEVTEFLTANELASLMDVSVNEVIAKCMELGMFVSINQRIDRDIIELIAQEFGFEVQFVSFEEQYMLEEEEDAEEDLKSRAPIVTVMGHVDHGKTSLLDFIRSTTVVAGEAGGITQHIGAYEVTLKDGRHITFLDTPGHEAFTAMRARGAQLTDIAIIVIAADDQVMPQTREAINHAQAAGVPMIIAINKVDKEGSNPEKIREQLSQLNVLVEEWGGKVQSQEISAKKGLNIDKLLDKVLLEAEFLDLKANPDRQARGVVVEAQLDKGRGTVATILVQNGTLRVGDVVVANAHYGRIKAMTDERGKKLKEAGPATPVQILGLDGVPQAGDKFQVMENDREARELATKRAQLQREQTIRMQKHITLEEIARRSALGDFQELNIIVKGDVDGSVEALADSLLKLSAGEVAVNIIMRGVGQISESDILLASASNAMVVGFQVRPSPQARKIAETEKVEVRLYSVIYDAINEIKDALEGLLKPKSEEEIQGTAEVREVFRISKVGTVAGCMVTDGKIERKNPVRLIRDGIVVYSGQVDALKRFKDDVREVAQGFECGISIQGYNDIRERDIIESFTTVEVKRTLAEANK